MKKGELFVTGRIDCGKCGVWAEVLAGAKLKSSLVLVKHLRKDGWRKTRKHGWVCSIHPKT